VRERVDEAGWTYVALIVAGAVLAWALFGIAKATEPPNPITDYVRQCAAIERVLHSMPTGCYAITSN